MPNVIRGDVVRQLIHSGGLTILIKVANGFLAYFMLLLIARAATAEQYGVFAVAFSITITASFISTVGQPWAIVRFWPQWMGQNQPDKARAFLKLSVIVTAIGLVMAMACILAGGALGPLLDMPWSFGIVAATALFTFVMGWAEYLSAALRAQGSVVKALAPRDIGWRVLVCTIFGGIALAGTKLDAGTIVVAIAILLLVIISPQFLQLFRTFKGVSLDHLDKSDRKSVSKSTAIMWGMTTCGIVRNYAGIVIVSMFLGAEAAGAYFVAEKTANLLSFLLLAVNLAVGPYISRHYHSGRQDIVKVVVAIAGLAGGATALIGIVFLALFGDLVLALFDPSYASLLSVLMVLSFGQLIMAATGPVGLLLTLSGHERVPLVLALCVSPLSIGLQVIGCVYYGAIGVAMAATTGTILANLAATLYAWQRLGIDPTGISLVPQFLRELREIHSGRR